LSQLDGDRSITVGRGPPDTYIMPMPRVIRSIPPARPRLVFDAARRRRHKRRNLLHSALLLGGMAGIVYLSAWSLWGVEIALWAMAGGFLGFLLSPTVAPDWVMRAYRARPVDRQSFPEGAALIEELSRRAGLDTVPRLYILPSSVLNAFAVGNRRRAAIAITAGLLRTLDRREFAGVLAHEISHVRNNDLWLMGLADTLSRLTSLLATIGIVLAFASLPLLLFGHAPVPLITLIVLITAPVLGSLLQLALSRAREFDADLEAATLTRDPAGLAAALAKLDRLQGRYWEEILLPGRRMPEPSLLRTHPPTDERVERLLSLYAEAEPTGSIAQVLRHEPVGPRLPVGLGLDSGRPRFRATGYWY
jgi:heat shock protein HtpX